MSHRTARLTFRQPHVDAEQSAANDPQSAERRCAFTPPPTLPPEDAADDARRHVCYEQRRPHAEAPPRAAPEDNHATFARLRCRRIWRYARRAVRRATRGALMSVFPRSGAAVRAVHFRCAAALMRLLCDAKPPCRFCNIAAAAVSFTPRRPAARSRRCDARRRGGAAAGAAQRATRAGYVRTARKNAGMREVRLN